MKLVKIALPLLLLVMFSFQAQSQRKSRRMEKADALFYAGEYFKAKDVYKKAYSRSKNRKLKGEISFKAGLCYRHLNEPRRARIWFRRAERYDYPNPKTILYQAEAYKMEEKYEDAIEAYNAYKELVPDDKRAEIGIKSCKMIPQWLENPTDYQVKELEDINTRKESDFSPVYSRSKFNEIYFTSTREGATGDYFNNSSGQNFSDIFIARLDRKGEWSEPVPLGAGINTEYDEGTPCLNKNRITMYFTRCRREKGSALGCKIYVSEKSGDEWGEAKLLEIVEDSSITTAHPAISPDELTLYFVADDSLQGGFGGRDIWKVTRTKKTGQWGKPENLGEAINTSGDEMFPYVRNDSTLYFSSNYHMGMGGLDIFRAIHHKDGTWTVENMLYPINSTADDFGIAFQDENEKGLFSSSRDSYSGDNLFSFALPELKFSLRGRVRDEETGEEITEASVKLIGSDGTTQSRISASDGSFRFELEPETDYLIAATKEGYFNGKSQETTKGLEQSTTLRTVVMLTKIQEVIELPNIEYDYAKATLRPISMVSLDKLVETLNDNPELRIELRAHTDYRGSDKNNDELSQARAQSVVDYLIEKGIDASRLEPKGYGERNPKTVDANTAEKYSFLNEGDVLTEEFIKHLADDSEREIANQLNRRTEFSVIGDEK